MAEKQLTDHESLVTTMYDLWTKANPGATPREHMEKMMEIHEQVRIHLWKEKGLTLAKGSDLEPIVF